MVRPPRLIAWLLALAAVPAPVQDGRPPLLEIIVEGDEWSEETRIVPGEPPFLHFTVSWLGGDVECAASVTFALNLERSSRLEDALLVSLPPPGIPAWTRETGPTPPEPWVRLRWGSEEPWWLLGEDPTLVPHRTRFRAKWERTRLIEGFPVLDEIPAAVEALESPWSESPVVAESADPCGPVERKVAEGASVLWPVVSGTLKRGVAWRVLSRRGDVQERLAATNGSEGLMVLAPFAPPGGGAEASWSATFDGWLGESCVALMATDPEAGRSIERALPTTRPDLVSRGWHETDPMAALEAAMSTSGQPTQDQVTVSFTPIPGSRGHSGYEAEYLLATEAWSTWPDRDRVRRALRSAIAPLIAAPDPLWGLAPPAFAGVLAATRAGLTPHTDGDMDEAVEQVGPWLPLLADSWAPIDAPAIVEVSGGASCLSGLSRRAGQFPLLRAILGERGWVTRSPGWAP